MIVSARNSGGYSDFSEPLVVSTELGLPGPIVDVFGLQFVKALNHIQLKWQLPSAGGDTWMWFEVQVTKGKLAHKDAGVVFLLSLPT